MHRVLQRHGVSRLRDLDRHSGRVIRRIETSRPGELVHIDIKKQARIPKGGGWRIHGVEHKNTARSRPRIGYAHVHSAIDAYSRLAYSEVHNDETSVTNIGFWRRAKAFFESYGITIERVLTDNGSCYRSKDFATELIKDAIKHTFTKPYKPQTNGKVVASVHWHEGRQTTHANLGTLRRGMTNDFTVRQRSSSAREDPSGS